MIADATVDFVEEKSGLRIRPSSERAVSGGYIHQSAIFESEQGTSIFLKQNSADLLPLFETESRSLSWLASSETIRVPKPLCFGESSGISFLAMEAISLADRKDPDASRVMGHQLSQLHGIHGERFGADYDNFIGATPQPNLPNQSWADFFTGHRLEHQFRLAENRGLRFSNEDTLLGAVHDHLSTLNVEPSLLHGDLWGGNASFDECGEPVFFDPASYFGDKEADIAFTRLFGGFQKEFYESYRQIFLEPEPVRETIYNLYHILNHFVLFGGGYDQQAEEMMAKILRTL